MNLLYPFRRADQLFGDQFAIRHESGDVTWRDFFHRAKRAASFLLSHIPAGERAAVLLLNRPEYLDLYAATALSGVIIVPLNTRWGVNDFAYSINDSESTMLIVDERFLPLVPALREQCPTLKAIVYAGDGPAPEGLIDFRAGVAAAPELANIPEPAPNDLAGLFYTSGTTGGPKAAMLTHGNLYANAQSMLMTDLPPSTTYLHAAPMFHLADIASLYLCTLRGTTHTFIKSFDPGECLRAIEKYAVTSTTLVPTMINMVVNHPLVREVDASSLRSILYGASPMPLALLRATMAAFPNCGFVQAYGMTELSPVVTMLEVADHQRDWPEGRFNPLLSAGRPVPGAEVRVVDDQDNDVPTGTPGEIIARGNMRMLGYWKRPDVNKEVLRGGWMHTGDMGCFDERGYLYVMDRKKDMIKTGGENVYSPEVESALAGHSDVLECAVIGVPHEKWGETIRAVVVRRPNSTLTETGLIHYCREHLTHFKCPTSVVFTDALPKGGTGKIQKNILREKFKA